MVEFDISYSITRRNEGGWHGATGANSADRGGETFKGIARRIWPNWEGWKLVDMYKEFKDFPRNAVNDPDLAQLVRRFYKREFWDANRLGDLRSQPIANEMFDTGVNVGVRQSALWLQRSVNLLNRAQTSWQNISDDGVIGPQTLRTVNFLNREDSVALFNLLNVMQGAHYVNLARQDPSQEHFVRGWLQRVELMR
jgi:lysozyme family protein